MTARDDESRLIARLRAGDEIEFARVVTELGPSLRRLVRSALRDAALIEEVVQETWLAVIDGLDRFEERASFRTWVTRIALNRAKTVAVRAARTVPLSALSEDGSVDADRFGPDGMWARPPRPWIDEDPESLVARQELLGRLDEALDELPPRQREVLILRDIAGWSSQEVCNALDLEETNQRVMLHRARTRLRALLEAALAAEGARAS